MVLHIRALAQTNGETFGGLPSIAATSNIDIPMDAMRYHIRVQKETVKSFDSL